MAKEVNYYIDHLIGDTDEIFTKYYPSAQKAKAAARSKSSRIDQIVYAIKSVDGQSVGSVSFYHGIIDSREGEAVV